MRTGRIPKTQVVNTRLRLTHNQNIKNAHRTLSSITTLSLSKNKLEYSKECFKRYILLEGKAIEDPKLSREKPLGTTFKVT